MVFGQLQILQLQKAEGKQSYFPERMTVIISKKDPFSGLNHWVESKWRSCLSVCITVTYPHHFVTQLHYTRLCLTWEFHTFHWLILAFSTHNSNCSGY